MSVCNSKYSDMHRNKSLCKSESRDQSDHKSKACESGLKLLRESHKQNDHSQKELGEKKQKPKPQNKKSKKKTKQKKTPLKSPSTFESS